MPKDRGGREQADVKDHNAVEAAGEKEVGKTADNEQTVKCLSGTDDNTLEACVPFLRAEHDLNALMIRIIGQNCFIVQGEVEAKENAQGFGPAKGVFRKGVVNIWIK